MLGAVSWIALKGVQLLGWTYYFAPRSLRRAADAVVAWMLRAYRPQIVIDNLKRAYPTLTAEALGQEARLFRREFARTLWGMVMAFGPHRQWVQREIKVPDLSPVEEAIKLGRSRGTGFIFVTGHFCNWEQSSAAMGLAGIDLLMVTKPLKSKRFHDVLEKNRLACGVKTTYEPRTLLDVIQQLKRGACAAMVLDQYTGPPVNVRVPFFGTYVGTQRAVAAIIRRTGAPVVFGRLMRNEAGDVIAIGEPMMDFKPLFDQAAASPHHLEETEKAIIACTAFLTQRMEAQIRSTPSQWLWTHRRFKGDLSHPQASELNYGDHDAIEPGNAVGATDGSRRDRGPGGVRAQLRDEQAPRSP